MTDSVPAEPENKNKPVENSSEISGKQPTILVVEDNAGNFMLIARMLDTLNVHCEWKTSGYEVVEFASSLPCVDLVLMDIRLPYEDGYGALRKIRQSEKLRHLPVVAVTAVAGLDQMRAARLAGFDGFIGKPLDPDRFPDQIRRILPGILCGNTPEEWVMTEQTAQVLDPATTPTFRGSLVRTVVIGLLIVSLVPVLVIGFASYLQIRQFMLDQAATQIQSLSENYNNQLSSLASSRQNALTELNSQANFDQDVLTIFQGSSAPGYNSALRKITDYLNSYITTPTEDIFSLLAIVDSGGNVIASSNSSLVGKPLTDEFAHFLLLSYRLFSMPPLCEIDQKQKSPCQKATGSFSNLTSL